MMVLEIVMIQMKNTDKKIAIISNHKPQSEEVCRALKQKLRQNNFILTSKNPDVVISVGGDGMLLSAFHKYEDQLDRVRFVGVHTGHLGFYTDYRDFEIDKLVDNLKLDTGAQVSYPILNVKIILGNGEVKTMRALNEATIKRTDRTMVVDLIINHVHFERFRGDGISVSTPTGSTAYNKSLGGAVLHPTIEALQVAEVASLNNRVYRTLGSSIIVPKKDKIELVPARSDQHTISIDNRTLNLKDVVRIEYQIDQHKIHFLASPSHTSFWNRVKDAFIGEADK
ncbi:NAD kinase [Streptococcus oricebi]|uniref:NAD kinase n=2 Tax=Streptococcus oricebi TaxID=1547447 RepID=A0ABS5B3L0_9STRE|nr:NAD kinase [Streptococcus oricebi]